MSDHLRPDPDPEVASGLVARVRSHLMDVTPVRVSADFRRLFLGRSISEFGDEIVAVAVPFQVYFLTHSTLAVGLLGLCELLPVIVFPIVGGAVADAVERRRFMVWSHLFLALMSTAMAVNASLDRPLLWPLYVFATLSAGMYTFNRPALDTWPARLLPPELLPSAIAIDWGFGTAVHMLGPVVAGLLLATSATAVYVLDAATFLVAIGFVLRMAPSPPAEDAPTVGWNAVVDGFRFLKGKRALQSVFLADLNAMIFAFPVALFPAVADGLSPGNGAAVLGLLTAAPAVGAFLATAFSGRAKHVRRQGRAILIAIVVWGAAIVVFGLSDMLWLSLAMVAIAGAGDMVSGIFRESILQTGVEDRFRGRLGGIGMAVWATGPSVGNVESGVVASLTTVPISIVSGGLLTIAGVAVLRWFSPEFWGYRSPATPVEP